MCDNHMAVSYRTKGFVFKKEDRQETDRMFSVFTYDFGRMEIFAKAIRKITSKLRGGIDIFSLSEIEFIQGKNRKTLTDATFLETFSTIARSPEKMEIAQDASNLLTHFIRGQESDEKIWDVVVGFFKMLNSQQVSPDKKTLWRYYFFWNFMAAAGFMPELSQCALCGQKLQPLYLYFSNKEGGIICVVCFQPGHNAKEVNVDFIKIARLFLKNDWQTIQKLKVSPHSQKVLQDISDGYFNYLTQTYSSQNSFLELQ
jgi:DNA repair protein RecO (recombination protein O)